MTRVRFIGLLLGPGILCADGPARGAGVTIVTHGFNSTADTWVFNLATAIATHPSFPDTSLTCYESSASSSASGLQVTQLLAAGSVNAEKPACIPNFAPYSPRPPEHRVCGCSSRLRKVRQPAT